MKFAVAFGYICITIFVPYFMLHLYIFKSNVIFYRYIYMFYMYIMYIQCWQKESGPSAILSKKRTNESETAKQITKNSKFVPEIQYFVVSNLNIPFWNFRYVN